jgi:hypothetical protein
LDKCFVSKCAGNGRRTAGFNFFAEKVGESFGRVGNPRVGDEARCAGSGEQCMERTRPAAGDNECRPEAGADDALYTFGVQSSNDRV